MRKASKREVQDAYKKVIEEMGGVFLRIERQSKHPFVHYSINGRELKHPIAGTSSDNRTVKNVMKDIRRRIREWKEKEEATARG